MKQKILLKRMLGIVVFFMLALPLYALHESSMLLGASNPSGIGTATISFDIEAGMSWNATGTMEIDFPTANPPGAFDLTGVGVADAFSPDGSVTGNFAVSVTGSKVTITRSGGGVSVPNTYKLALRNVKNPALVGTTGTYTYTLKNGVTTIDTGTAAASVISEPITLTPSSSSGGGSGLCLLQSPKNGACNYLFFFFLLTILLIGNVKAKRIYEF